VDIASAQRPKAVFYDHSAGDPVWRQYCSFLSREGIPFVSLAHKSDDEIFLEMPGVPWKVATLA
jgi:hypothetical protein